MKIIALVSWYDESPTWLSATVASLAKFCDHVVAVDGAYQLYPKGRGRSPLDQAEAITRTAEAVGIGLTLYQPTEPWEGNEVEKRNMTLRLAETVATPFEDWYVVIDGDEVILDGPRDIVRARLQTTDKLCATYGLTEFMPDPYSTEGLEQFAATTYAEPTWTVPMRSIYRAIPGLVYLQTHYIVTGEVDGEQVFLMAPDRYLQPAEEMHRLIRVEHRNRSRIRQRAQAAREYYAIRDSTGIERLSNVYVEAPDGEMVEV